MWAWVTNRLLKFDKWLLSFFWLLYSGIALLWALSGPVSTPFPSVSLQLSSENHHLLGCLLLLTMLAIFPLLLLRSWIVRTRTERGLSQMVRGVSSAVGIAFFRSLAFHLAKALHADYVVVGTLGEKKASWVSTEVVYGCGSLQPNFSYRLADSPSESIVSGSSGFFPSDVQSHFPEDPQLRRWEAESFAGTALVNSGGKTIGVLTVIGRQPFKNRRFVESMLQVFAVRAAGEMERQQAEKELRRRNRFYQTILNAIPVPVFYKRPSGEFLGCNAAFENLLGLSKGEIVGRRIETLLPESDAERHGRGEEKVLAEEGTTAYETILSDRDARRRHLLFHKSYFRNEGEGGLVGTMVDITRQKTAEETARYLEHFDSLTRLPNQVLFTDRLNLQLAHSRRLNEKFAVFALDLDHFKKINNVFGHQQGDQLLREVAERLSACLREDDTVARMGGDSFTLLLPNIRQAENAAQVAQKILDSLKAPFTIEGRETFITASLGIAIYPEDGTEAHLLLKNADTALNRTKEKERDRFRFFQAQMNARAREQLSLLTDLRRALEREEFVIRYQPQFNAISGELVGAEALVRWHHPERGLLSPDLFIPLAEESGMILPLGELILRSVCCRLKSWQDTGLHPRIAVNLSARQFEDPSFYRRIDGTISDTGVDPKDLGLEITESTVMEGIDRATSLLKRLKLRGIHIAIDDFGTGHSSLGYIKRFPIDTVKIDRSFIEDLPGSKGDAAIVSAVLTMAGNLGVKVLAEGVETVAQMEFLQAAGCNEFQGFLFSEPLSEAAFTRILEGREEPERWPTCSDSA